MLLIVFILARKIQSIPKKQVEIVSSVKSDSNENVVQMINDTASIERNNTYIDLNSNNSVKVRVDDNSSDAVWKQNESETSQTTSQSNIPVENPDIKAEKNDVQDASNASAPDVQMPREADSSKVEPSEHMPSFDEWKKEKLEEEKKKGK